MTLFQETPREALKAAIFILASYRLATPKAMLDFSSQKRIDAVGALFKEGTPGYYHRFDMKDVLHMIRVATTSEWTNDGIYYINLTAGTAVRMLHEHGISEEEALAFGQQVLDATS